MTNPSFAVWNYLEFFLVSIFHPQLVESEDEEPADMKG